MSTSTAVTVRYDTAKDWVVYGNALCYKAKSLDLWQYINPETLKPWPTEPEEPNISVYHYKDQPT